MKFTNVGSSLYRFNHLKAIYVCKVNVYTDIPQRSLINVYPRTADWLSNRCPIYYRRSY